MTPSPGLCYVTLHFNFRAGATSVWVVLEGEGSAAGTLCVLGGLSFSCHAHAHVDSFLWAWEVQPARGFGLGGGGGSPAVAGETVSLPESPGSPEPCTDAAGMGLVSHEVFSPSSSRGQD